MGPSWNGKNEPCVQETPNREHLGLASERGNTKLDLDGWIPRGGDYSLRRLLWSDEMDDDPEFLRLLSEAMAMQGWMDISSMEEDLHNIEPASDGVVQESRLYSSSSKDSQDY